MTCKELQPLAGNTNRNEFLLLNEIPPSSPSDVQNLNNLRANWQLFEDPYLTSLRNRILYCVLKLYNIIGFLSLFKTFLIDRSCTDQKKKKKEKATQAQNLIWVPSINKAVHWAEFENIVHMYSLITLWDLHCLLQLLCTACAGKLFLNTSR